MNNGASSADFYIDAVTNNSFEMSYVENTLLNVFHNSYGFLDNAQKHAIGLCRSNFLMSDLNLKEDAKVVIAKSEPGKIKIQVSRDLIDPSMREEYRQSKFYRQVLSLSDITNNQDIFVRMPIVYIDGMMITQYTVKAFFDKTFIYIKNTPEIRKHENITVFFVMNDGMSVGRITRKVFNSENNKLPASRFSNTGKWETPFTSIVTGDNIFGVSSSLSTSDGDTVDIEFSDDADLLVSESNFATVTILRSKYMHVYPNDGEFINAYPDEENGGFKVNPFTLTDSDGDALKMPIPTENIIVFKRDFTTGKNCFFLDNAITVSRIYPNIYIINDPNATDNSLYRVAYFYHPLDGKYHYTNYLANAWKLARKNAFDYPTGLIVRMLLTGYKSFMVTDNVSEADALAIYDKWKFLLSYQPPDFEYTIPDFMEDSGKYPFDYKIDKMREAIQKDPWVLHDYVRAQSHCNYGYELDVSRIRGGLESRRRMSSASEAKYTDHKQNFKVPCYVFNFNIGSKINFELTFFINGLYVEPEYVFEEFFTKYIYIPCDLVDENSIIDVEENSAYVYEKEVDLSGDVAKRVTVQLPGGSSIHPLMKDIKVKDESGYTLLHSEVQDNFEFRKRDGQLEFPITDKEYTPITTFTVKYNQKSREFDAGEYKFTIIVDRSNTICDYTSDDDPILVTMMPRTFWDDPDRVRVFVNGKLIDQSALIMTYYDTEHSILLVRKPLQYGDVVNVLLSPNHYNKVLTIDSIPFNGIIDLSHELNKPVNLTYYDFYLNGRKLTSNQIVQLSPNIVQIHDVRSTRNLAVYEKDRDPIEYFGEASGYSTNYESIQTLEDQMLDENGKYFDIRMDLIRMIWEEKGLQYPELGVMLFDLEPDVLDKLISAETADMIIYIFKTFYWLSRINPDEKQVDSQHVKDHLDTMNYWLNADSSAGAGEQNVFSINPDIMAGTEEIVQPISGDKFYTQYKIDYEKKE